MRVALSDRSAAPFLVLLILALTSVAGFLPLGAATVAARDTAGERGPVADEGRRAEPAGPSGAGVSGRSPGSTDGQAGAPAGSANTDPAFAPDGTLLKPAISGSGPAGIAPVTQRHRTQRGDSLWAIAQMFGTDTMSIWWANIDKLRQGLNVGSLLTIPRGHGVLHRVIEGDSLTSVAAMYGSSPETVRTSNGMRGDVVVLGQVLLIPDGRGPSYPKGLLLAERRAAREPAAPAPEEDSAIAGYVPPGYDAGYGLGSDLPPAEDPLSGGALTYGARVADARGRGTVNDGPTTGGTTASAPDGSATGGTPSGSGAGAPTAAVTGSSTTGSRGTAGGAGGIDGWSPDIPQDVLDAYGITRGSDSGAGVSDRLDDATRATRQLEAAAAQAEARQNGGNQPLPVPRLPGEGPQEGDPGISDEDQLRIPPFDPELARLAAAQLRADLARWGGGPNIRPTVIGERLPYSGEDVMGVPSRSQLLRWPGTAAEKRAGLTWLSWPVTSGRISQLYSEYHHAIDVVGPSGSFVKAAATGRVVWAGWRDNGGGYQVWVRHQPGLYTGYYHMSRLLVRPGQSVVRGKAVGVIGNTGHSHGTHLHFEVWRDGVPGAQDRRVNPLRYTKAG